MTPEEQTTERSVEHATFTVDRTYDASRAQVFAAWADPEAKARWFGPAEEEGNEWELDFRVGGKELFRGTGPDGNFYTFEAIFRDIVPDERIVYSYDMHLDKTRISVSLATVELKPEGKGTQLVFTEQGGPFWTATTRLTSASRGPAVCWTLWARSCGANSDEFRACTPSHR